jgi:hypothetical protein
MATAPTTQRFNLQPRTTAEITEFATALDIGSRLVQSEGLSPNQMAQALRQLGYEPMTVWFTDPAVAMMTLYPYVESGIAPILLVSHLNGGYHTVTCVGHTYNPAAAPALPIEYAWSGAAPIKAWRSWQWVTDFIIHDDQRGPYRLLRFLSSVQFDAYLAAIGITRDALNEQEWHSPVIVDHEYKNSPMGHPKGFETFTVSGLLGAVIAAPSGVSLSAAEAERKSARIVQVWAQTTGVTVPDSIHLRTYLANSNEFKNTSATNRRSPPLRHRNLLEQGTTALALGH